MREQTRGQIPQVFIFLMAIMVIGATLFIGVKMFGILDESACEANDAAFMRDLKVLLFYSGGGVKH